MRILIGQLTEGGKARALDLQVEAGSDDALITEVVVSPANAFQTAPGVRVITTGRYMHKLSGTLETFDYGEEGTTDPHYVPLVSLISDREFYELQQRYRERVGWTDMSDPDTLCVLEQMAFEEWGAFPADMPMVTRAAHEVLESHHGQLKQRVRLAAGTLETLGSSVAETLQDFRRRGVIVEPLVTVDPESQCAVHDLTTWLAAEGVPFLLDNSDLWQRVIGHLVGTMRWMVSDDALFPESWNVGRARQPMAGLTAKDSPFPPFDAVRPGGEYQPGEAAAHGADREPFKPTKPDDARIVPRFMFEEMRALDEKLRLAEEALGLIETADPQAMLRVMDTTAEGRPPVSFPSGVEVAAAVATRAKAAMAAVAPTYVRRNPEERRWGSGIMGVDSPVRHEPDDELGSLRSDRDMWRQSGQAQAEKLGVLVRFVDHVADGHRRELTRFIEENAEHLGITLPFAHDQVYEIAARVARRLSEDAERAFHEQHGRGEVQNGEDSPYLAGDADRLAAAASPRPGNDRGSPWDRIHPSFHNRRGLDLKVTDDDILRQTTGEEPSDQLKVRQLELYGRHGGEILAARQAGAMAGRRDDADHPA